jgi:hypothetical protein
MKLWLYFYLSLLQYWVGKNIQSNIVWSDLFFKFSYRYPEKSAYSFRIFFTFLKKSFLVLWRNNHYQAPSNNEYLVLDISNKGEKERLDFCQAINPNSTYNFIAKDALPNTLSVFQRLWFSLLVFNVFLTSLMISLFYRKKGNLALLPVEFAELLLISYYIKENQFRTVLFFSAYEKDTSFVCNYLINKKKVRVVLIPSPNPISNFYQKVICSTFAYTIPYQKNEYELLKQNWILTNHIMLPNPSFLQLSQSSNRITKSNSIGYISSGNWLRKELGHSDPGAGGFAAEENLIELLSAYLANHDEVNFFIALHPLEKRNEEYLKRSTEFYKSKFNNFSFLPFDKKTSEIPELFDIAISAYSSAIFERLYAGYKGMFSQKGMKQNYFNDEKLFSITKNDYPEFETFLNELFQLSNDEYFINYNLQEYTFNLNAKYSFN